MDKLPHRKTFRRTFLTGLVIVLPVVLTGWIVYFVFGLVAKTVTPFVREIIRLAGLGAWSEQAWVNIVAPLVSVALSLLFIYLMGLIGGNVIGRQILSLFEKLLLQVPFVRAIYSAMRQFFQTFTRSKGEAFSRVVLVEYPRKDLWTMALVTARTHGEVQDRLEERMVSVFVPTTPNPTSGWLLFVPEKDAIFLDMSVDDAFKMIISGGVITPTRPAGLGSSPDLVALDAGEDDSTAPSKPSRGPPRAPDDPSR
ncbi:DUF502 domain-containing protein [Myxococcota bacterium]